MFAGELRHYVTIQTPIVTQDTAGGQVLTWTPTAYVWAAIEPLKGKEFLEAKLHSEIETRIRIRALSSVKEKMRVYHSSGTYEIIAVVHLKVKGEEMHLMCKKVE